MIEVFKTNVEKHADAKMLLHEIHKIFTGHEANFDLEDCDKILRVKCKEEMAEPSLFIRLLYSFGFRAEVLPDLPCLRYEMIK
ncbi:MAG: hypothetical protein ABIN93_06315 [Ginsengibacter sp.]